MKNFLTGLFLLLTVAVHGEEIKEVPVVTIQTNLGPIEVELNPAKSPETVENFLTYVKDGFYEGTIFHRVIESFVVQGGGYTPDFKKKPTHDPIPNEAANGLKNVRGTVAMARTSEPHSASSQFFFNVKDNKFLDYKSQTPSGFGYCVFGKVVEGMELVDKISKLPTDSDGPFRRDVPQTAVIIEDVRVAYAPPTKWVMAAPEKSPPSEKKKDKPEMPSMMEMQQDMLSDIENIEEEKTEKAKETKEGATTAAKTDSTDSAVKDKTAEETETAKADKGKADKGKADTADSKSETADQSEESQGDAADETDNADQAKSVSKTPPPVSAITDKPEDRLDDQAAADIEEDTGSDTDPSAPGVKPKPSSSEMPQKVAKEKVAKEAGEEVSESEEVAKEAGEEVSESEEAKDSSVSKSVKDSPKSNLKDSAESEAGADAATSADSNADDNADAETQTDTSTSAKIKPTESKPVEDAVVEEKAKGVEKNAKNAATEEEKADDAETGKQAEKSEVTRSAMAISNATNRVDVTEEEEKPTDTVAKVTPKPAVKTPPPGAKPPDSPTLPDKPEPLAN